MGSVRTFSPHVRWSEDEVEAVRRLYPTASRDAMLAALPGRSPSQIQNKANWLGIIRVKPAKRTPDQAREASRQAMAEKRARDPAAARAYSRGYHEANRERQCAKMREYQGRRFFWWRARRLDGTSARDIASLWKRQKGLCGLTGRRLDRSAHLDHILPRAKGGSDDIANLRWVCVEANLAKRDLTDAELVALCADIMRFIGERIDAHCRDLTDANLATTEAA